MKDAPGGTVRMHGDGVSADALTEYRAALVKRLRNMTLDETPTNVSSDMLDVSRDAGYRAGHNDLLRNVIKLLELDP
jgi:hypothetical protein